MGRNERKQTEKNEMKAFSSEMLNEVNAGKKTESNHVPARAEQKWAFKLSYYERTK